MTDKDITPRYFAAPDGRVEPTLWRSNGQDDEAPKALFTKSELDKVDPILWPTLVRALAGGEGGEPHHDETARLWRCDNGNLYRWSDVRTWEAYPIVDGQWIPSTHDGPEAMTRAGLTLVEVPAAVAGERCSRCDSPDPKKHPAVQFEGEVELCPDPWHQPTKQQVEGAVAGEQR